MNKIEYEQNPKSKFDMMIDNAVLALPPEGLEIFETKQTSSVIGEDSKISKLEVKNLFAYVKKSAVQLKNELFLNYLQNFLKKLSKIFCISFLYILQTLCYMNTKTTIHFFVLYVIYNT